ncbi:MAG: hypothetical protein KAR30_10775 [Gammaproteobacteria bacterium]|nr:hypothetical protein [Gammaproteobacteria bacterium]
MDKSLKAALLSGLVLPGLGQFFLKRYKRGAVLVLVVLGSMFVIISKALDQAWSILEKIQVEGGTLDMVTISNAATQAVSGSDNSAYSLAFLLIVVCWVSGVVDAYWVGKKNDQE